MRKGKTAAAIIVSIMMGASLLGGCSSSSAESSTAAGSGDTVYGIVSAVDDSSITIDVGTLNEQKEKPDENAQSSDANFSESNQGDSTASSESTDTSESNPSGEAPSTDSMIATTGETKTIKITSSTKVTQDTPQAPQGDGNAPGGGQGTQGTPPEKPSGSDASSDDTSDDASGDSSEEKSSDSQGTPPEKPSGESDSSEQEASADTELSVSDLSENEIVSISLDSDGNAKEITVLFGGGAGGAGGGDAGGQSAAPTSYTAAKEYSKDTEESGKSYSSDGTDENAVHVTDGAEVTLLDATVARESEDSEGGDSSSFYGIGAAILTTDGISYVSGSKVTTNAAGGAGIFSYGDGTTYVSDTTIATEKDTSGGIHVAGGGKLYAWDVTATTEGNSSAAIRSDRGGGTMVVDGGSYTSNGTGSPAVYSTADITVHDADLTANNSESVCIEGLNSLRLFNCNLTGNMKDDTQNDCTWNVILYQSMSGDSEVGNSTFDMEGGTLTAKNGGMFYTTNTESTIRLSDVDITYAKDNDFFLKCTGNANKRGWGTSGANGADCNFTAEKQAMEGDVIWDSISELDFYMTDGSTLKGAVTDDESNAGDGGDGYCNLYIDEGCTWTVTGDSTLTNLYNAGTIQDADGNTVTVKGTDGTVYVKGESEYTITVSSYSEKADMSGMTDAASWSDYEASKPEQL